MDYRKYHCSVRERILLAAASVAGAAVLGWLFYQSWYALLLAVPLEILIRRIYQKRQTEQRKKKLLRQFGDGMRAVSAALAAGYSMENAWREAERELKKQYGENAEMCVELNRMNTAVRMSQPLEKLVAEFAVRSACEDIESFAEVFCFAKRSGGNYAEMIKTTVQKLTDRMEVEQEIQTVLAGKKLEGRIMNLAPLFLLAYLNLTSGEFMSALYGNVAGVCVMTAALSGCLAAVWLSERLLDIRV